MQGTPGQCIFIVEQFISTGSQTLFISVFKCKKMCIWHILGCNLHLNPEMTVLSTSLEY